MSEEEAIKKLEEWVNNYIESAKLVLKMASLPVIFAYAIYTAFKRASKKDKDTF